MKKSVLVAGAMALALALPMIGCSSTSTTVTSNTGPDEETTVTSDTGSDENFDMDYYAGQWRGSVETTGETVYGTAGGNEQMLDVYLEADGTCSVVPVAAHADLLTEDGTWTGSGSTITLHLSSREIALTIIDGATMEANAADFDIADFDTINFDFYG